MQPEGATNTTRNRLNQILATKQGQSYAVLASTIFLAIVLLGFGALPILSAVFTQVEQNAVNETLLQQMRQKEQTIRALITTEASKRAVTLALQQAMPRQIAQADILGQIKGIADDHEVTIALIAFGEIEGRRNLATVFNLQGNLIGKTLTLNCIGSRFGIEEFLSKLEDTLRIYNIRNMSIFKREPANNEAIPANEQYRLDIQAEVYYIGTAEELAAQAGIAE